MSAIAVLWEPGRPSTTGPVCDAMVAAQRRYGPDHQATRSVDDIAMGGALFRLVPEDRYDRQPLVGRDGDLLFVADARLDNRRALAAALALAPSTRAESSDADLLLLAWERWGDAMFSHLVGDFAFAAFDRKRRELTIARDPLGQRPLVWTRRNGRIAIASMPVGLFALSDLPRIPNPERAARQIVMLDPGQSSFYTDIQRVQPGHVVCFTADRIEVRRHWSPRPSRLRLPRFDDYVDAYRERLDEAVAARLRRDATPLAAHLSGGWDSGAVVSTAVRLLPAGERLTAFTSVPSEESSGERSRFHDEGPLAGRVAAAYRNIDHLLVANAPDSPIEHLAGHPDLFGRPMVNLCNHVWLARIRTLARERGAQVMLTGEIGNFTISNAPASLLADHVRAGRWGRWAREAVGTLRAGRGRLRGVLAASFEPWMPRPVWRQLERFGGGLPSVAMSALHPDWSERFADEMADRDRRRRRSDFYETTLTGLQALDLADYHKGVLGGWGIDKRDPTADVRIIEFMLSLPPEMFLNNGTRRPLAREALSDRLPAALLDERRKGYQAPDWHVGLTRHLADVHALIERIAADPVAAGVVDVALLRRLVAEWPIGGWHMPVVIARYRTALLTALSIGAFLLDG